MLKFKDWVVKVVNMVPYGKVVSYGQVALYVGMPRAARQVGWILNGLEGPSTSSGLIPWWRVVNNQGRISIKGSRYSAIEQKEMLESEGIVVKDDLTFDIEKYRFNPDEKFIKKLELDPAYLEMIADKIGFSKSNY
jgi:methylated-DNA-protein-cysteine methyltransferase related protein